MRVEALHFKRCCCCFPLRQGLLCSGYFKLVVGLLSLVSWMSELVQFTLRSYEVKDGAFGWVFAMKFSTIILALADADLTIVFLIGCHKKDAKLLKIYYYYSIVFCTLTGLGCVGLLIYMFLMVMSWGGVVFATFILRFYFLLVVFNVCLQVYLIFLTRSEFLKLENHTQFSFTNNANEAECTMVDEIAEKYVKTQDLKPALVNDDDDHINVDDQNNGIVNQNGNYTKLN